MAKIITRNKIELDATDMAPGRLATKIAMILRGKTKPDFQPHIDSGDFVTILNASKVKFTGRKLVQKDYRHHTMHPGGLKTKSAQKIMREDPGEIIRHAVYGMLPKNNTRNELMKRLTIKK